ncbi:HAUS augmin-like complex subunit 3 isoform X2 [Pelodiscus sinensis]|uniref:HAUS augmin-like complex subunit 3 isoform X2 n=1 Tax=Pelodiscus sinensis TaxID=13735 RepID=UPI003F6ACCE1
MLLGAWRGAFGPNCSSLQKAVATGPAFIRRAATALAMFTRRRSRGFLLDAVNRGAEFVETLKTCYPKAEALHEKDFDWLFDCPEMERFLAWFCTAVGEENVLAPGEVEAYEVLLGSGKPVLEGEALEQALQTCRPCPQLRSAVAEDEAPSLEALEQEAQALHSQRARQLQRRNKLQGRAAGLKQALCRLAEQEERAGRGLRQAQLAVEVESSQTNSVLSQACTVANKLAEWLREAGCGRLLVLMSEADLGRYLELEELATGALAAFIQKALSGATQTPVAEGAALQRAKGPGWPQAKPDTQATAELAPAVPPEKAGSLHARVAETQAELGRGTVAGLPRKAWPEEDRQEAGAVGVGDLHGREGCRVVAEGLAEAAHTILLENPGSPETELWASLGSSQQELKRMGLAYLCSWKELTSTAAEVEGIRAGLQWAERALKSSQKNKLAEEELGRRIATFQEQLRTLQRDLEQTQSQRLVPLLQVTARLLHLPVLSAGLEGEAAGLGDLARKQEEVAGQLLAQHSRLELLGLQLTLEMREQQQVGTWLEETAAILQDASASLRERLACLEDASLYIKACPRTLMDSRDFTSIRLWEMLEKQGQEKQLFHTYETLASRGSRLRQERRMLEVQLAVAPAQLPALESANELLYRLMYGDSNQLLLNAQELAAPLEHLYTIQGKLYQMLMDLLSDLRAKQKSLKSHLQQTERNLYVHFFHDARRLREVVQQLEKQALAFS